MRLATYSIVFVALFANQAYGQEHDLDFNKKLVSGFYTEVLLNGNSKAIDRYIGDEYTQHNPNLADGKEALRGLVESFPPRAENAGPAGEIVRIIAEGDLVVLHVRNYGWPQPNGGAIVDIFRVKDGKIVEHWDVVQAVPETSANENTMF